MKKLQKKYPLNIIYPLLLVIICIAYANGIIPTGFYTDDFVFMERVQEEGSFLKNVFDTTPLGGSYYRPILTLIWGVCYRIFGLWSPGYNIVELFIYIGILIFFYKTISLLSNCTIAFIASIFLLLHTASDLLSWLAWITTISELFFVWFTIYFIVRNRTLSRNIYLFFIACGTVFAILSKETTYIPLLVILFYYAVFERPDKKLHSYVYGLLIIFILLMMIIGPSGVFRSTSGHNTSFISINLHKHLDDIMYNGFPILVIPFLFSMAIFVKDRNIFKSFAFYILTAAILMIPAILNIYGHQILKMYGNKHIEVYLLVFIVCILILIWRKYLYEFFISLANKKALIWYFLFACTFAPILTFYLPTRAYHFISFSFLLTALAITYFIWADKIRTAFLHGFIDNKNKFKNVFSMNNVYIVVIISSLLLNSFMVAYEALRFRAVYAIQMTEKKYRKAMSNLLENVADSIVKNSKSNSLVVSKENSRDDFSDNSRFLFIHIRHKYKNFKIIFNPAIQIRDYNSDFVSRLELLGLDSKISFDPETEKYIMEKAGENLIKDLGVIYFGFHSPEQWSTGIYRWSRKEGIIGLRSNETIELDIHVSHPDIEKDPVILSVYLNKELFDKVTFKKTGAIIKKYYIPNSSKPVQELSLKVSRTWNPYNHGINEDNRDLGVAVSEIKLLDKIPADGIGFYDWETYGGGTIPEWPKNLPVKFRWTGMRASMSIENRLKEDITLFLLSSHPDNKETPVIVKIFGNDGLIREEIFTESKWGKVVLKNNEIKDSKILTLQVDRTWKPKSAGISQDDRDLGVAVAIPEAR